MGRWKDASPFGVGAVATLRVFTLGQRFRGMNA
jgi:hypothetical protein